MPPRKPKKKRDSDDSDFSDDENFKKQKTDVAEESEDETEITLTAPTTSGRLLICGCVNWDLAGRSKLPKGMKAIGGPNLLGPNNVKSMKDIPIRSAISSCTAVHNVIIDTHGMPYTWGRNDKGQLGFGDTTRRDIPTTVESLTGLNIITAACGKGHTLFLSERGQVYSTGDNKMGQLGLGNQGNPVPSPTRLSYKGPPITRVACGGEFSMIIDIRGNLYSFGLPEYGQLGHNTDGKYFVASNKMAHSCETRPRKVQVFIDKGRDNHINSVIDVEVVDVACGLNHTVIMDSKKRVFTWGFGGYGRLGHSDPKDEMVPRMVKFFEGLKRGATTIAAGSTFSMALSELGALYCWGKTKATGEANMYPKPLSDLSGWLIRSIGCCNLSIVLAADESIVSWGCSPTYGELGYGESKPKSSSTAQEAKPFDGTYIQQVAGGYSHSLFIARANTEEEKKILDDLPDYDIPC